MPVENISYNEGWIEFDNESDADTPPHRTYYAAEKSRHSMDEELASFAVSKYDAWGFPSGTYFNPSKAHRWTWHNYHISEMPEGVPGAMSGWRHLYPSLDQVAANRLAAVMLAQTNPSRPSVSIPSFIGELKDLPGQIRQKGGQLRGSNSVGVHFGILPLVSDVLKLTNMVPVVNKHITMLRSMLKEGGAYRRRTLERGQVTGSKRICIPESNFTVCGAHTFTTKYKTWGTCRWTSTDALPDILKDSDHLQYERVRALLTGISSQRHVTDYVTDAWELIPWSWLGDWYGNIGTYLDATQNQIAASCEGAWIMRHSRTTSKCGISNSDYGSFAEDKQRFFGIPHFSLTASEVLTPKQLSILGGLATKYRG